MTPPPVEKFTDPGLAANQGLALINPIMNHRDYRLKARIEFLPTLAASYLVLFCAFCAFLRLSPCLIFAPFGEAAGDQRQSQRRC